MYHVYQESDRHDTLYVYLHTMTEHSKQTYMLHVSLLCKNLIDMIHCMFTLHTMTEHSKQTYMLHVSLLCKNLIDMIHCTLLYIL
jgi:hypothetical protein